jgi:hypothetical protein
MCVVSLDHHCPFVCNCVARGNRRVFVAFLMCGSAGCLLFTLLSLYVQYAYFCPAPDGQVISFVATIMQQPYAKLTLICCVDFQWSQLLSVQLCMLINRPALLVLSYVTFFTGIWIGGIFCGQMGLIAAETTTFEVMKNNNQGLDMFTARGLRNVLRFFNTGNYPICSVADSAARSACGSQCSHSHHGNGHSHGHTRGHAHGGKASGSGDHIV